MKSLLCLLAQRSIDPRKPRSGMVSKHVGSCEECQAFRDNVRSVEARLKSPPDHADETMCRDIMGEIKNLDASVLPPVEDPMDYGNRPWLIGVGVAAVAVIGIFVISQLNFSEESQITEVPVVPVPEEQPETLPPKEPMQSLASLLEQKEFLRRDARKLGAHLRDRVILFKTAK